MGMSFIGSYSGIDQATIDKLMEAERMPLNQLTRRQTSIKGKMDAWKDVNTRLNTLFEKMKALQSPDVFTSNKATSTNEGIVSIGASKDAAAGSYKIHVEQLATNASIIGGKIPAGSFDKDGKFQGTGTETETETLTFRNHEAGEKFVVDIKKGDTLEDIVKNINALTKDKVDPDDGDKTIEGSGSGISASIIDGRIVLTDEKTGERNITFEDDGSGTLEGLGLGETGVNRREPVEGKNAIFTMNGVKMEKPTNTIDGVVKGLTINLKKAHGTGESDTITVGIDTDKATKAIQDFVDQYNSTMKFIEEKTAAGDPEVEGSRGDLAGESSLQRLQSTLRGLVTDRFKVEGSDITDISQLGVTTKDKSGMLVFDKDVFSKALEKDRNSVENFFNPGENSLGEEQDGFADRINNYVDSFISKENGLIKSQNESFEKSLKDLDTRIENFEARMVRKEKYYIKTFTALDIAMMKAEDQMSWLQGQVDAMNVK